MPKAEPAGPPDERPTRTTRTTRTTRASISFPANVYEELERIAGAKKVSLAWVVRDAAEKYVADQWPLLEQTRAERS